MDTLLSNLEIPTLMAMAFILPTLGRRGLAPLRQSLSLIPRRHSHKFAIIQTLDIDIQKRNLQPTREPRPLHKLDQDDVKNHVHGVMNKEDLEYFQSGPDTIIAPKSTVKFTQEILQKLLDVETQLREERAERIEERNELHNCLRRSGEASRLIQKGKMSKSIRDVRLLLGKVPPVQPGDNHHNNIKTRNKAAHECDVWYCLDGVEQTKDIKTKVELELLFQCMFGVTCQAARQLLKLDQCYMVATMLDHHAEVWRARKDDGLVYEKIHKEYLELLDRPDLLETITVIPKSLRWYYLNRDNCRKFLNWYYIRKFHDWKPPPIDSAAGKSITAVTERAITLYPLLVTNIEKPFHRLSDQEKKEMVKVWDQYVDMTPAYQLEWVSPGYKEEWLLGEEGRQREGK